MPFLLLHKITTRPKTAPDCLRPGWRVSLGDSELAYTQVGREQLGVGVEDKQPEGDNEGINSLRRTIWETWGEHL